MTDRKNEPQPTSAWQGVLREAGLETTGASENVPVDCAAALLHLVHMLHRLAGEWGKKAESLEPSSSEGLSSAGAIYADCSFEMLAALRAVLGGRAPYSDQLTEERIIEIARRYVVGGLEFDSEDALVAFVRYLLAGGR